MKTVTVGNCFPGLIAIRDPHADARKRRHLGVAQSPRYFAGRRLGDGGDNR